MDSVFAQIVQARESAYRFLNAGQVAPALALFKELAAALVDDADVHLALGICLLQVGEHAPAESALRRALAIDPREARIRLALGRALKEQGRFEEAIEQYRQAGALGLSTPDLAVSLGIALRHAGHLDEAAALLRQASEVPQYRAMALTNLGAVEVQQSQPDAAVRTLREAIALQPGLAEAHNNLGKAFVASGAVEDGEASFAQALRLRPAFAEAMFNLGNVMFSRGRVEQAADLFSAAYAADPGQADACVALAQVLFEVGALSPALERLDLLVSRNVDRADVHLWRGLVLREGGRFDEAVDAFRKVVEAHPVYTPGLGLMASTLWLRGDNAESSRWADRALALEPGNSLVLNLKGNLAIQGGKAASASDWYRKAIEADETNADAHSNLLFSMNYAEQFSLPQLVAAHCEWGRRRHPAVGGSPARRTRGEGRCRVGFVSPDFNLHSVAHFVEPLLAHLDRQQFEVFCYANSRRTDSMTARLAQYPSEWRQIVMLDDRAAAQMVQADGIDVLIDLAGHTSGARLGLFARPAAAVQATYLGYPTLTGLPGIAFRITDAVVDPVAEVLDGEAPIRLPHSYFCYRPPHDAPPVARPPAGAVTFGSFNNFTKISDATVALWCRALHHVPGSRLLLKNKAFTDPGLRAEAVARFVAAGVEPGRLDFRAWSPDIKDHLSQYDEVSIALDSIPYNGATTTCEALWMGVPVVTLHGSTHAGRMGASILRAAGQPGLVAADEDEFAALCARLAADADGLMRFRRTAREAMRASPLMDEGRFARDFEDCLRAMEARVP